MFYRCLQHEASFIHGLQKGMNYNKIQPIIKLAKYITRKWNVLYFIFITFYFDWQLSIKLGGGIVVSRVSNYYIKNYFKVPRPYNRFPGAIKYYKKKKKLSYSFPSQSIQNITVLYYIYLPESAMLLFFYWGVMFMVSTTRMIRGLHYPHDIFFSYLYSYFLALMINYF